ncbi:MAG: helix-turn-helix domain-containing protein [Oscillospiraceae bacterium]|nr:helix-turn-helix domain-containing protein [Oscillospiraceae bacterium]
MFYEQLKKACLQKGTTPTALAREFGLSTGNTGAWKNGGTPSTDILVKFSNRLDVTTDFLLGKPDLIDLHVNSIRHWANNSFFTEDERKRIEEHFQELLIRYKDYVNYVCDLVTGVDGERDVDEIKKQSLKRLDALQVWIERLPGFYFDPSSSKSNIDKTKERR